MFRLGDVLDKNKALNISPVVLAFVGDAVHSLFVREKLVYSHDCKTGQLNKLATAEVKATAQAQILKEITPLLTEEEIAVFKRGRNAKKSTKAKNASVADYNTATGFESLIGYLYIIGQTERLNFLLNKGITDES